MQPTSRTWTRSPRPASSMAAPRSSITAVAPEDRQPAAVQTRTWTGLREARSFSAIARRSSRSIVEPSFQVFQRRFRLLVPGHLAVEDHDGGQPAGAQAPRRHERDPAVGRRLARDDPGPPLDGLEQRVGPIDVARRARADDAGVLALGRRTRRSGRTWPRRRRGWGGASAPGRCSRAGRSEGSRRVLARCGAPRSARRPRTDAASCSRRAS